MECANAHELLHDLRRGRLDAARAAEVRAHLEGCAECRREEEAEASLDQALSERLPRYPAPAALRRRVEQLAAASRDAPLVVPLRRRPPPARRFLAPAAIAGDGHPLGRAPLRAAGPDPGRGRRPPRGRDGDGSPPPAGQRAPERPGERRQPRGEALVRGAPGLRPGRARRPRRAAAPGRRGRLRPRSQGGGDVVRAAAPPGHPARLPGRGAHLARGEPIRGRCPGVRGLAAGLRGGAVASRATWCTRWSPTSARRTWSGWRRRSRRRRKDRSGERPGSGAGSFTGSPARPSGPPPGPLHYSPMTPRVLVVDDKENILKLFASILADGLRGHHRRGRRPRPLARGHRRFDVVVTDIRMPGAGRVRGPRGGEGALARHRGGDDDRLRHRGRRGAGHEGGRLRLPGEALRPRRRRWRGGPRRRAQAAARRGREPRREPGRRSPSTTWSARARRMREVYRLLEQAAGLDITVLLARRDRHRQGAGRPRHPLPLGPHASGASCR